jgi:hypothetical protein
MILSAPNSHHLPLSLDAILLPRCYSAPSMLFCSLNAILSPLLSRCLSLPPTLYFYPFHSLSLSISISFNVSLSYSQPLTCLEYIVSEALYECVVFVRLESWAVLGNNLVKPLDAAVTHSLMGVKGIM